MTLTTRDSSTGQSTKPRIVEDYSKLMGYVDQSDQMTAYTFFTRKTTKCYIRVFPYCNKKLINTWMIYNEAKGKIKINDFNMLLIGFFGGPDTEGTEGQPSIGRSLRL